MSALLGAPQNQTQATMLVQAAEAGDFGAVEALIAAGVDVNSANEHGMTALMAAAANGHLALVSFLLERGADFSAKRFDGFDALALAVFYGHKRIVRELVGRGADLKATDRLGTSPEMWATVRGFHDIAQVLTDAETINSAEAVNSAETINSAEAVDHQSEQSKPVPELISAQKPVLKVTKLASNTSSPQRSFSFESSYVESAYVPKPRYHHKRKSGKLVRWLAYITSDLQRLTGVTLIVILVCGLGTVAVFNLLGLSKVSGAAEPAIITEAPTPDSDFNAQNDLQSGTRAQQIQSTSEISEASAEPSILAEKKSDDRGGRQVDNIEHSSSLRVAEPLPKASTRVEGLRPKEALTPKQETQADSRSAQSFRSPNVSAKSISSTNVVGGDQENPSGVKAPPRTSARPLNIKTQRPRRVAGRNDRLVPAATPGRNTKAKVIQWP